MISIPFTIPEVHAGFSEASGIIRMEEDFLVFQVQTKTFGMFNQNPETVKIEFGALYDVRHEKGVMKDKLFVRPKKMQLLDVMPGKHGLELQLKVKRKHRSAALILVDAVRRQIRR